MLFCLWLKTIAIDLLMDRFSKDTCDELTNSVCSDCSVRFNGHKTEHKNNDTLHEADVRMRTLHVACNLRASWCSFFELCNEAVIARWRTIAGDLRFDCDLNATACTTRKYLEPNRVSKVRKQTNSTMRCALTWFHVESITRVSRRAPLQFATMRSSFRDIISLVGTSVGTFSRGPFDDRLNLHRIVSRTCFHWVYVRADVGRRTSRAWHNARKVINAHCAFLIGLKRTSEPKGGGSIFSSNGPPHTLLHPNHPRLQCDFCNFELPSGILGFPLEGSRGPEDNLKFQMGARNYKNHTAIAGDLRASCVQKCVWWTIWAFEEKNAFPFGSLVRFKSNYKFAMSINYFPPSVLCHRARYTQTETHTNRDIQNDTRQTHTERHLQTEADTLRQRHKQRQRRASHSNLGKSSGERQKTKILTNSFESNRSRGDLISQNPILKLFLKTKTKGFSVSE
jgi:hypothetical protein